MPTYLFQCRACRQQFEVWAKIAERNLPQAHCGTIAERVMTAAMVAPMFEPYRAVGLPGKPWIRSKAEHCAQLRDHGYEEVGNDASMAPPAVSDEEFAHQQRQKLTEIKESFSEKALAEAVIPNFVA